MAGKWNSESTIKFIQEFKCHECLWNTKYALYKVKPMREASWQKVVHAMTIEDVGVPEAKKKMRNLRSTYYQENGKIKKSKVSDARSDYVYVSHVKWFGKMDALLKVADERRETIENVEIIAPNSTRTTVGATSQDVNCDHSTSQENDGPSISSRGAINIQTEDGGSKPKGNNSSRRKEIFQAIGEVRKLQELINKESTPPPELDNQFDIYSRSVAAQLKSLPIERALLAQSEIQRILTEHAMAHLTGVPLRMDESSNVHSSSKGTSLTGPSHIILPMETSPNENRYLLSTAIALSLTESCTADTDHFSLNDLNSTK